MQTWWLINQDLDEAARLRWEVQELAERLAETEGSTRDLEAAVIAEKAAKSSLRAENIEKDAELSCLHFLLLMISLSFASLVLLAVRCRNRPAKKLSEASSEQAEDQLAGQGLGVDFGFGVLDSSGAHETLRLVKIQCPGVEHRDVEAELLFNGCQITIQRRASQGVEAATWRKRFEFPTQDGLFEFKEDQMRLEHGFLHLVFRAYQFQSRVVRFPKHFALSETDADQWWEYPDGDEMEPKATVVERTESTASTSAKATSAKA